MTIARAKLFRGVSIPVGAVEPLIAVRSGQALKLGENRDADVLLVHHRAGELKFIDRSPVAFSPNAALH